MLLNENHPNQADARGSDAASQAVRVKEAAGRSDATNLESPSDSNNDIKFRPRDVEADPSGKPKQKEIETIAESRADRERRPFSARSWVLAGGLLITILALAGSAVYLITKKPSTVDQIIILTVPSGAEIELDSKPYGQSPVKLEQLNKGTYTLTITKENYEPIVKQITVSENFTYDYKLKLLAVPELADLPLEEQIRRYQSRLQEAFDRGFYALGYNDTALYYADYIIDRDPTNQFAKDMRERIQKIMHQTAQEAVAGKDLAKAQEIYTLLVDHYPEDRDARVALSRIENQLSSRKDEVRDLVRKAEEALQSGILIEPKTSSAYYYSKLALAIDRQNAQALAVRNQIKERIAARIEDTYNRGDYDTAFNQMEKAIQLFPEDKQLRARQRELVVTRTTETAKASDPNSRRIEGLGNYQHGNYSDAIPDLEYAITNGRGTTDVIFALARSYMMLNQHDRAAYYFNKVQPSGDDAYRSAIAALGDIAKERGDTATALAKYKEARQLGGSPLYPISTLDDKIEKIEKKQRDKAAEPVALTIRVKHMHGGFMGGSCGGTLTINSTGVRYDGTEHTFSSNLVAVGVRITKDEMIVRFQDKSEKFKVGRSEADHFSETLSRFQQTYAPINK